MSKPMRAVVVTLPLVIVAALIAWGALNLTRYPTTVLASTSTNSSGQPTANLTLQTVPTYGHGSTPDWVSYLAQSSNGTWHHTTMLQVPAHSLVHVTIYQYDSGSALRNPFMNQVLGTVGGTEQDNSKTIATTTGVIGHTFTVPALGLSVFLPGISADAKNPCQAAPCTTNFDHNTIQFTFRTGAPGTFHWQCFVPCGTDFVDGFGGPMSTLGYMGGFLKVVA